MVVSAPNRESSRCSAASCTFAGMPPIHTMPASIASFCFSRATLTRFSHSGLQTGFCVKCRQTYATKGSAPAHLSLSCSAAKSPITLTLATWYELDRSAMNIFARRKDTRMMYTTKITGPNVGST